MANKLKDLPAELRPFEKVERNGAESLNDQELLAVLLRSGTKDLNVLDLSAELLRLAGGTLAGLYGLSAEDLTGVPGIGRVKAIQIQCLRVLVSRIAKSEEGPKPDFSSPERVFRYYAEEYRMAEQERVKILFLNTKMRLMKEVEISKGTIRSSPVPIREILVKALRENVVTVILIHNHPSGDPEPSEEDIRATEELDQALKMVGLTLADHIIIGGHSYVSLREKGIIHGVI